MLCGTFAFRENDDVICVADMFHSALCQFLVKFVEIDICQQWREGAALWGPFLCSHDDAVFHDAAFEIFLDELYDASIFDGLSQEVQEQVVVNGVEVFAEVDLHGMGVAFFCIFLHFAYGLFCVSPWSVSIACV